MVSVWVWSLLLIIILTHMGHSVYINTAVTSPEILGKLRIWTKKRARSFSYNHIKMMQSMVYLISLFTLILIKWHVTSPEILTTYGIMNEWILNKCRDVFSAIIKTQLHSYIVPIIIIKDCLASSNQLISWKKFWACDLSWYDLILRKILIKSDIEAFCILSPNHITTK